MTAPHPGSIPGPFPFPLGGSLMPTGGEGVAASSDDPPRNFFLDENHDIVVTDNLLMVGGVSAIAQDQKCAMKAIATFDPQTGEPNGEWFLDLEGVGLPWFRDILGKGASVPRTRELIRRKALSRQGIKEITSMELRTDARARRQIIEYEATTDTGELVAVTVDQP